MDPNAKNQVIERIKEAQNILVTVSKDPSIDQLAATIGLTLLLNKFEKRATAVFSGAVPSTLQFLKPEDTIEQNTDSLRDFIISLDKSKADKLRYKVEDDIVRIFITPYRTKIDQSDLIFSQGDFNIDLVIALGVDNREHIDDAIIAHGRILHDAGVVAMSTQTNPIDLGNINWQSPNSSSLSEMVFDVAEKLKDGLVDGQIATALLTGIVAETDRFKNERTTPKSMTISAKLMAAGANQQLVVNELSQPEPTPEVLPVPAESEDSAQHSDVEDDGQGTIQLHHENDDIEDHHIEIDDNTGRFLNAEELRESEAAISDDKPAIAPEAGLEVPNDQLPELPSIVEQTEDQEAPAVVEPEYIQDTPPLPGQEIVPTVAPGQIDENPESNQATLPDVPQEFPKIIKQSRSLETGFVSQSPKDEGSEFMSEEPELPSIEQGQQQNYSKYIDSPPIIDTPVLNSAQAEAHEDILVDPTSGLPKFDNSSPAGLPSTPSPLLSVADDAESPSAPSIPSTSANLLADDGESIPTPEKPLGPAVDNNETLADIEDTVAQFEGVSNVTVSENNDDASDAATAASAEEAARKAVFDAIAQQDQPLFPEPNQNIGAQFFPLDSDPQKDAVLPAQPSAPNPQSQDEPPSMPPPIFPFGNQ